MTPRTEIPFFGNPDSMSCGQCVYRMALQHFHPEKDWSFAEMNALCGAVPKKYTWPYLPVTKLSEMGLDVLIYDTFDTEQFLKSPRSYLHEFYGEAAATDAINHSDMDAVINQAKTYTDYLNLKKINVIKDYHSPQILRQLLDDGYLVNLWVNSAKLNNEDGFAGHFILVHGYEGRNFIAHDPGGNNETGTNPTHQTANRLIPQDVLYAACCVKAGETDNLIAIKR